MMKLAGFKKNMTEFSQDGFEKLDNSIYIRDGRLYSLANGRLIMTMKNNKRKVVAIDVHEA